MSFIFWFSSAQALIAVTFGLTNLFGFRAGYAQKLKLHYSALGLLTALLIGQFFIPVYADFALIKKAAVELSFQKSTHDVSYLSHTATGNPSPSLRLPTLAPPFAAIAFLFAIFSVGIITRDLRRLNFIRKDSYKIRKIGRLEILAHDQVQIPLTYWLFGRAVIIIPTRLLAEPNYYRISVLHELQHQRQRDPIWMYVLQFFKTLGYLNPLARTWVRQIHELQEFACDETLVDRSKVNSRQYARCLLRVAESALPPNFAPNCATGLIFGMERSQLKRRITMLVKDKTVRVRSQIWPRLLALSLMVSTAAYAAKGISQNQNDRTLSLTEAQSLAKNISGAEGITLQVNEAVVKELNFYLGTAAKRQTMKAAVARMKDEYQTMIDVTLAKYELPAILKAIPLIESRYQNLPQSGPMKSAGIWQFIPDTARRLGLTVKPGQDDRLNPTQLTDAASRLIKSHKMIYNDLGLAILAYNWGENKVNQIIEREKTRQLWALVQANNNDDYLPKVMAGAIIIANPKVTE